MVVIIDNSLRFADIDPGKRLRSNHRARERPPDILPSPAAPPPNPQAEQQHDETALLVWAHQLRARYQPATDTKLLQLNG
ncbi:hypothetical protein [Mycobacterium botniense]|uniref:hypothetical protein n=1 Tax=Mycobacterium botniense TaxID=84962 RepID=UPI0013D10714|nr:hypothetical protein [Mycobacterium botniense]